MWLNDGDWINYNHPCDRGEMVRQLIWAHNERREALGLSAVAFRYKLLFLNSASYLAYPAYPTASDFGGLPIDSILSGIKVTTYGAWDRLASLRASIDTDFVYVPYNDGVTETITTISGLSSNIFGTRWTVEYTPTPLDDDYPVSSSMEYIDLPTGTGAKLPTSGVYGCRVRYETTTPFVDINVTDRDGDRVYLDHLGQTYDYSNASVAFRPYEVLKTESINDYYTGYPSELISTDMRPLDHLRDYYSSALRYKHEIDITPREQGSSPFEWWEWEIDDYTVTDLSGTFTYG